MGDRKCCAAHKPEDTGRRRHQPRAASHASKRSDQHDQRVVIVGAAPVGAFNAVFQRQRLSWAVLRSAALARARSIRPMWMVVLGQILRRRGNPARQAAMQAQVPQERTAYQINQLCGSGLRAVALASQAIALGDADIVVAGGQESMSQAPHCAHLRNGHKMGDVKFVDTMLKDGLWDAFHGYHMGNTAENVARQWQLTATSRMPLPLHRKRPKRRKPPVASRTRSSRSPSRPARRDGGERRDPSTAPPKRSPAAACLRQRKVPSPPATPAA